MDRNWDLSATPHAPALSRQARKAETRRALIQAAAALFAEQGMERTSVDEIAARVGLTKGAVYANFRNKEELIDAVSVAYSQVSEAEVMYDASLSIAERIARLGDEVADFMPRLTQQSMMLHLEFDLYLQRHPDKAAPDRAETRRWFAEEGARLEAVARERGEQLPVSGAELWALLLGAVRGIGFEWLRDPTTVSSEGVAAFFAMLGRGIESEQTRVATANVADETSDAEKGPS